jgi:hypothetical protein
MASVLESPGLRRTVWGRDLPESAHICAFFDSEDQEYDCLGPYFAEGLAQGEQVVTIRDAGQCNGHVERLKKIMPHALDEPIASNQLRVVASEEAYLQDGCFESERMYQMLEGMLGEVKEGPFRRVRTCGAMSWALREFPGTEELMEYEARVNKLTHEHDCTLMCVYDINKFSGRAVMDVLATHPIVVMGDRIYENQYYVEPTDFLQTLLKRGSAPLARNDG